MLVDLAVESESIGGMQNSLQKAHTVQFADCIKSSEGAGTRKQSRDAARTGQIAQHVM